MSISSDLRKENEKLAIAHGYKGGKPNYRWEFSENLYFPHRKEPLEYDYVANDAGIIMAQPVFELKKMCPRLNRQWVLCRFMEPCSETAWKNIFGSKVEWPRNGYYAPTNVELDESISPWDTDSAYTSMTDMLIGMITHDRNKSIREWNDEGERIVEYREKDLDRQRSDQIDDLIFPYPNSPHIPGQRGGPVSFGGTEDSGVSTEKSAAIAAKE